LLVGNDGTNNRGFPGQLDDIRITKGIARYAGTITAPTEAFPDTDHFSTLLTQGLVRETVGASEGVLQVQGLVREVIGAPGVGSNRLLVQGLVREIVRPAFSAPPPLHANLSATLQPAALTASARVPLHASLSQTLAPATLTATARLPITANLSIELSPLGLVAHGSITGDAIDDRITEDNLDRITETDGDRVIEQYLVGVVTGTLEATLEPATVSAFTGRVEVHAWVDGLYIRVTERSPSTLHPEPGADYLTRNTEQWWEPPEPDYRILQHKLIAGATVASATATLRSHVGERHFLTASRQRIQLTARSDFRKTRAA